ncbi:hypothetical protein EPN42_04670 [bacterium]|nr:MAG: hypothetical protein EPN42_04670 [bacterium]
MHWLNAEQTPIRCLDRRVSSGHGVLGVTSAMDGCVRVYLRTCEPEVILHEAMHAIVFVTGFKVDQCQPLDEIFSLARRTHRTIDPAFANIAWSYSLTNRDEFLAQLAAMTLTEPDYDPAHPLLHPCAELLWPGSTEAIMAVETAINDACLQKEPSQ